MGNLAPNGVARAKFSVIAALTLVGLSLSACGEKAPAPSPGSEIKTAEIADPVPKPAAPAPATPSPEQPAPDLSAPPASRDPAIDDLREIDARAGEGPSRAGPVPPPPAPQPGTPAVALPDDYEIVSNVLLPTESYLPKSDGMPTGLVLLDSREKSKNDSLCKALLGARTATVRTEAAARRDNPRGDYLVTHWPVRAVVANEGDCVQLSASYDFDRAKRVKQAYALQDRRGPLFLALDPTGEIVFLDLEDASAQDVFKATSDWMALALAAPQTGPNAGKPPQSLMAGANKLFAKLAGGFSSLVGGNSSITVVRFNDPVAGTSRQFNIYKSGVYLIGATFVL